MCADWTGVRFRNWRDGERGSLLGEGRVLEGMVVMVGRIYAFRECEDFVSPTWMQERDGRRRRMYDSWGRGGKNTLLGSAEL